MTYSKYVTPMDILHLPSSGAVLGLGGFVLDDSQILSRVRIDLAKFGTAGGSEALTAKIFTNPDLTAPVATSTAVTLATLQSMAANWLGFAWFTFPTAYPLTAQRQYYLGLTSTDYTKVGTTFFIAAQLDTHSPFNTPAWGRANEIVKFRIEGTRQWPE